MYKNTFYMLVNSIERDLYVSQFGTVYENLVLIASADTDTLDSQCSLARAISVHIHKVGMKMKIQVTAHSTSPS